MTQSKLFKCFKPKEEEENWSWNNTEANIKVSRLKLKVNSPQMWVLICRTTQDRKTIILWITLSTQNIGYIKGVFFLLASYRILQMSIKRFNQSSRQSVQHKKKMIAHRFHGFENEPIQFYKHLFFLGRFHVQVLTRGERSTYLVMVPSMSEMMTLSSQFHR